MKSAQAFAPASVANVAVGFDVLGFSIGVTGDTVFVEKTGTPEVRIESVSGVVTKIPLDPKTNTATAGLVRLRQDLKLPFGFNVSIQKGIPMGSGMGGSAASAVAAIVAANALLDKPLSPEKMIAYALIGEAQASGSFHADNVAPCLLGGLTLTQVKSGAPEELPTVEVTALPLLPDLHCILIHPELSVETKQARGILRPTVTLHEFIEQSANLAGFVAACFRQDTELLRRSLKDTLIEPQRAHLIPGFREVQAAALSAGAIGCSIAGAGPSVFAWVQGQDLAQGIEQSMLAAFQKAGVPATGWIHALRRDGARVV